MCLARSGWELTIQVAWRPPGRWVVAPCWQIFVELWAGQPLTRSLDYIAFVWNRFPPVFSPQTGRSTEGLRFQVGLLNNAPESPYFRPCQAHPSPRQPDVAEHPAPGPHSMNPWEPVEGSVPYVETVWKGQYPWYFGRDHNSSVLWRDDESDRLIGNVSVTYVSLVPWRRERRCHFPSSRLLYHRWAAGSRLGSLAKTWICNAPAAYLYSRCDQRQLDAIITCQCALARLVYSQSGLVSLSEIPIRRSFVVTSTFTPSGNEGYIRNRDDSSLSLGIYDPNKTIHRILPSKQVTSLPRLFWPTTEKSITYCATNGD